jgi:hypothetical protein
VLELARGARGLEAELLDVAVDDLRRDAPGGRGGQIVGVRGRPRHGHHPF